nr:cytochrome P450 [Anaerolineae bacterium]
MTLTLRRPPGQPPGWIGGNMLQYRRDPLQFLTHTAQRYGDVAVIKFGRYFVYQVNHPEDVHQVLVTQADKFHKAIIYKRVLSDYLGNGLLISDGDFWKRQRKLAQPAFHTRRIEAYAAIMVEYTQRLLAGWAADATRDLATDMMRLTLYIVAKTLFDADVAASSNRVGDALEILLHSVIEQSQKIIRLPEWLPTPARYRKQWSIATLDAVMMQVIEARRAAGEDRGDLLSMLMLAQTEDGQQMTDRQVRDEALTIFLAGHETTANAMTWTFYLLSQHPAVEARLHAELDSVLGGRVPALEDLKALVYTEQVLKPIEDVVIGGYTIPRRDTVLMIPYVIHRDARWFPQPHQFDPERFRPEQEKQLPRYAYMPFGGGPRVC